MTIKEQLSLDILIERVLLLFVDTFNHCLTNSKNIQFNSMNVGYLFFISQKNYSYETNKQSTKITTF